MIGEMMTKTFIDILEELEKISSTNDKIDLIKANKDNVELKEFLRLALDKNITFGIADIEDVKEYATIGVFNRFNNFIILVNKLQARELTGNDARDEINKFLSRGGGNDNKWYINCLKKDLASIGFGQRNFEDAYDEKGFKFRLMLAAPEEELDKIEDEAGWLDKKANGVCTIIRIENSKLEVIYGGRNGLVADSFYFLKDELETLCSDPRVISDCVFHGETHVLDCLEDTMSLYGFKYRTQADFMGKKGLKEKAWADYQLDEERINKFKLDAKFCIFEQLTLDEWDTQICTRICDDRKASLEKLQKVIDDLGLKRIEIIPTKKVPNQAAGIEEAQILIKKHKLEGGIYKRGSGVYEWKRSRNSVKIKEVVDFEIEFDTFEIQKDKYNSDGSKKAPMIGKVWGHDLTGNNYKIGTGKALPEDIRIDMLNNWDSKYKGKIGTCSAQRPSDKGKYICARLDIIRLDRNSLAD